MKLEEKKIVKKNIFFSPNDILVDGPVNDGVSPQTTQKLLGFLKGLEDRNLVELFLILGLHRGKAVEKARENSLGDFFREENVFFVTDEYINSKEEIDRERHREQLDNDPDFVDEYFTQHVLTRLFDSGKISRGNTVLIGHDVFFDGFYTMRFSKCDFVLVGGSLSDRNRPLPEKISGLNYIDLTLDDFKKVLLWKFPKQDLRFLETYVFNRLREELLSKDNMDRVFKASGKPAKK